MTSFAISRISDEQQTVWGWASVIEDAHGHPIVDSQGDIILKQELQNAAHDFLLHSRDGGVMHEETGVASIVESLVTTPDTIAALFPGVAKGSIPVGWAVAFKVNNSEVWKRVKSGELAGFSIHGVGERVPVEAA